MPDSQEYEEDSYEDEEEEEVQIEREYIDTGVDFVDENGLEKSQRRSKRRSPGFWYWLNNFNDGRTCYAALPGDIVR